MCVNYTPSSREELLATFRAPMKEDATWPDETYANYLAPIIRLDANGERESVVAAYSMIPKPHMPPGVKRFSTMNARFETISTLRSYSSAWKKGQLCLSPMTGFFEPNWTTGVHERWWIGMRDATPFAVAGLWRDWNEADGSKSYSFTQLTVNADADPLMSCFHRPGQEKRSLVIVPPSDYDAWLSCRDTEVARSFMRLYPAELMAARPAPKPPRKAKEVAP